MIINNSTNNYTLSSYNMQQKVDIIHSIRIETSYTQSRKGLKIETGQNFYILIVFQ